MKYWLIFNLAIALVFGAAQTCMAPRGSTFTLIKVVETEAGTRTELVRYWRGVSQ